MLRSLRMASLRANRDRGIGLSGSAAVTTSSLGTRRSNQGFVVVIDDLSELLRAQKPAAWQEVAQRIAHELKNPLTPIMLSAQPRRFLERAELAVPKTELGSLVAECAGLIERESQSRISRPRILAVRRSLQPADVVGHQSNREGAPPCSRPPPRRPSQHEFRRSTSDGPALMRSFFAASRELDRQRRRSDGDSNLRRLSWSRDCAKKAMPSKSKYRTPATEFRRKIKSGSFCLISRPKIVARAWAWRSPAASSRNITALCA